jgi:peptidoglycan/xylan/chitin deacetylase (PgdA/CDA1 family)
VRIGYDLFSEVRTLLTTGQPPDQAGIPTLELHIALLRDLIIASGAPLAEIPPVPDGYPFIACLTHDVDHPSIRQHKFDHTMFGFLYRAIFGSFLDVVRGRVSVSGLLSNWTAALKLPLVYMGLAEDFWHRFQDYPKMEKGLPSSFFVIPFKGRPGRSGRGPAPSRRAAGYGAADIAAQIRNLMAAGCEIGLHGIDAWRDSSCGREELDEIRHITGAREVGVRMHWLYFDEQSPLNLESAGATYDSTVGYNETVGYRAGTTQAYKPLQATRLLELPLHVMDTALFYPGRLNLSPREARKQVSNIIGQVGQFGGSITVNWHDRSIAPERQWGRFYEDLVDELKSKGAWFSTAAQAVAWFQKRRSVVFESVSWEADTLRVKVAVQGSDNVPSLRLRIHNPRGAGQVTAIGRPASAGDINISLNGSIDARIPLGSSKEMILPRNTIVDGWVTTYVT